MGEKNGKVFDEWLVLNPDGPFDRSSSDSVKTKLMEIVKNRSLTEDTKVVMIFDEAQHLLGRNGFYFRAV
jgi:hypothetical protein